MAFTEVGVHHFVALTTPNYLLFLKSSSRAFILSTRNPAPHEKLRLIKSG